MPYDIRLGQCFCIRFSKDDLVVRIDDYCPGGGWVARSLSHGRKLIVKDTAQILYRCDENGIQSVADETTPNRRSKSLPPPKVEPKPLPKIENVALPVGPLSLLDATAIVLRESRTALSTREIIELIVARALWQPTGATPWATLNAALNRDIQANGSKSRFSKKERGKYSLR